MTKVSHILYAFAKTDPLTGKVSLSDPWADIEKPMPLGGKGCLGELYILKQKNRNMRVVLSIGGWSYRNDLTSAFASSQGRAEFARSAIDLVKAHWLDGLDIDWEYPENAEQAQQYVEVLKFVREGLNELALQCKLPPSFFDLSVAAPAGAAQRQVYDIPAMNKYLTFWNLMSYDLSGAWSPLVAHHANLFGGPDNVTDAVDHYVTHGVPRERLVLGMPLYGRSFAKTKGLNHKFEGTLRGCFEQGVHDLRELPFAGTTEMVDCRQVAAYCKGPDFFVTYDNAETLRSKAVFAKENGLGGGMWWEASGDRPGRTSAIDAFVDEFGLCPPKPNWISPD